MLHFRTVFDSDGRIRQNILQSTVDPQHDILLSFGFFVYNTVVKVVKYCCIHSAEEPGEHQPLLDEEEVEVKV